jgi:hypothetical protein
MATPVAYTAPTGLATLYVATTGSDTNPGTSGSPFATISKAATAASAGTVVMVAPGTYQGGFSTLTNGTSTNHITYFSTSPKAAIIGGVGTGVVTSNNAAWENRGNFVDVIGFVIDGSANANGTKPWQFGYYNGGGNCSFKLGIVHDIMTNTTYYNTQSASGNGGAGIENDYFYGGSGSGVDRTIVYNIGPPGLKSTLVQTIYQSQQNGAVSSCLLYNSVGAGVELWHAASAITIVNNTIYGMGNVGIVVGSGDAGGTTTTGDNCVVNNNIVVNCGAGGIEEFGTTGTGNVYNNNLVFNNTGFSIQLQHGLTASNTVTANPLFVGPTIGNFKLQAASPAIDAGTSSRAPTTDLLGYTNPQGAGYDIGAYN